ncbi:hypothetical protein CW304_07535 [Bacillus sp. UFRGS-B20]|nr:hypothetical protein CW304_07535 [Bacillus sp. UFRGS-B20]
MGFIMVLVNKLRILFVHTVSAIVLLDLNYFVPDREEVKPSFPRNDLLILLEAGISTIQYQLHRIRNSFCTRFLTSFSAFLFLIKIRSSL